MSKTDRKVLTIVWALWLVMMLMISMPHYGKGVSTKATPEALALQDEVLKAERSLLSR